MQGSILAATLLGITRSLLIIRDTHAFSHFAFTRNQTENHMYRTTMRHLEMCSSDISDSPRAMHPSPSLPPLSPSRALVCIVSR